MSEWKTAIKMIFIIVIITFWLAEQKCTKNWYKKFPDLCNFVSIWLIWLKLWSKLRSLVKTIIDYLSLSVAVRCLELQSTIIDLDVRLLNRPDLPKMSQLDRKSADDVVVLGVSGQSRDCWLLSFLLHFWPLNFLNIDGRLW